MSSHYYREEKPGAPQPIGLDADLTKAIAAGDPQQQDTVPPDAADASLIEALTKKAHDFDAVRKSVEDAAAISGTLWFSYLFTSFYIAIAAGAVTHKDLLLENAVKLPFLNVELPLVAFFFLAPVLFIIVHAYVLMHFILLAAKIGTYNDELEKAVPGSEDKAIDTARAETRLGHRRQLPSNIFVQFLAGPKDIRKGGLGRLLQAIAWISLVIGPVVLLLLLQIQFLPYHLEWVTWVQRIAVLVDIALLWFLWPPVLASRGSVQWPRFGFLRTCMLLAVSLLPLGMAFVAARFPGEWLDSQFGDKKWIPANPVTAWLGATDVFNEPVDTSLHDLLFGGGVDQVTGRPKSLFSNTLVLPGFDALEAAKIDDQKKLDWVKHTLDLHARHLEGAVFARADLRKADFLGAHLEGASLFGAQLQGASLDRAHLQGAFLLGAHLHGASLNAAQLQGASLDGAQLQGASLDRAHLQGARLEEAQLQSASLDYAGLQGTSLNWADLQGAWLIGANLQGASLYGAQLQGASLDYAQLEGASLDNVQLQGTSLLGTQILRADALHAHWGGLLFTSACNKERVLSPPPPGCDWKKYDYERLKHQIEEAIQDEDRKNAALKRISRLNPDQPLDGEEDMAAFWAERENSPPRAEEFEESVKNIWREIGCDASEAPYVVRGFLQQMNFDFSKHRRGFLRSLAKEFLDPEKCPGARGLSEAEIAQLKKIRDDAE